MGTDLVFELPGQTPQERRQDEEKFWVHAACEQAPDVLMLATEPPGETVLAWTGLRMLASQRAMRGRYQHSGFGCFESYNEILHPGEISFRISDDGRNAHTELTQGIDGNSTKIDPGFDPRPLQEIGYNMGQLSQAPISIVARALVQAAQGNTQLEREVNPWEARYYSGRDGSSEFPLHRGVDYRVFFSLLWKRVRGEVTAPDTYAPIAPDDKHICQRSDVAVTSSLLDVLEANAPSVAVVMKDEETISLGNPRFGGYMLDRDRYGTATMRKELKQQTHESLYEYPLVKNWRGKMLPAKRGPKYLENSLAEEMRKMRKEKYRLRTVTYEPLPWLNGANDSLVDFNNPAGKIILDKAREHCGDYVKDMITRRAEAARKVLGILRTQGIYSNTQDL